MNLPSTSWRDQTRKLLIERPRTLTYEQIEKDTGLGVRWLQTFANGSTPNPGIVFVETLHTYLTEAGK